MNTQKDQPKQNIKVTLDGNEVPHYQVKVSTFKALASAACAVLVGVTVGITKLYDNQVSSESSAKYQNTIRQQEEALNRRLIALNTSNYNGIYREFDKKQWGASAKAWDKLIQKYHDKEPTLSEAVTYDIVSNHDALVEKAEKNKILKEMELQRDLSEICFWNADTEAWEAQNELKSRHATMESGEYPISVQMTEFAKDRKLIIEAKTGKDVALASPLNLTPEIYNISKKAIAIKTLSID